MVTVERRPRLMIAVTHPMTARLLLRGQLGYLRERGFEVAVIASPGPHLDEVASEEGVQVYPLHMARTVRPDLDLAALPRLVATIRRFRPDILNAGTPKAGLLGMIAARLLRVPVRIYTVRGLRLETAIGQGRRILAGAERVAASSAHRIVCVSESLRRAYLSLGLTDEGKTTVLGSGSSNGVDVDRFQPAAPGDAEVAALRRRLGIPEGAPVVGFVGRFTRDKGLGDLAEAFFDAECLADPEARLLLVGDFEDGDPVAPAVRSRLESDGRVVRTGFVSDPAPYYRLMDVLAFPSYREGFPNAPLEAGATGVPVVGYAATGTVDAVRDGETGILVPVGDRRALRATLCRLLGDPALRRRQAAAGRRRAVEQFRREAVWAAWEAEYRRLLNGR